MNVLGIGKKFVSIKESSQIIGVTTTTLRRWEISGLLKPSHRTLGNHRRYLLEDILFIVNGTTINEKVNKKVVCYARVSSHDQKRDLNRQIEVHKQYCLVNNYDNNLTINDLGSGLNFKKKGLNQLIRLIINNEVDKLILTHKDRLLRFGSDLIISLAKHYGVETIIINKSDDKSFEQELAGDVLEIITVFSAKLYGSRSHKNMKREVA